jgi:hypothetical protein
MSKQKPSRVTGRVVEAKYYPAERSLAIVIEDFETKKRSKPLQISVSSFSFRPDQDIDDEMHKTASLFLKFPHPVTLVFDKDGNASL